MTSLLQSTSLRDFDPDRLLEVVRGAHTEHLLLESTSCDAELLRYEDGDLSVDRGAYGFGVAVQGEYRPGFLAFAHVQCLPRASWLNGVEVSSHHLQYFAEGSDLLYRAAPGTSWTVIQIRRATLQAHAERCLGRPLRLPAGSFDSSPVTAKELSALLRLLDGLAPVGHEELSEADSAGVRERVLDALVDALADPGHPVVALRSGALRGARGEQRVATVRGAQALLAEQEDGPYDSASLCEALGLSERTLQSWFRGTVGISPRSWLRLSRLHRARGLLQRSRGAGDSVTEIALRCGFQELGRFAVDYRRQFGERPSETLRGRGPGERSRAFVLRDPQPEE